MNGETIRTYRAGDEDEIARLLNECFDTFKSSGLTGEMWLETFEHDPGYRKEFAFVAEKDGRIVSHVQLVERRIKVGASANLRIAGVANVATLKEQRRLGISTRLTKHALNIARNNGYHASALITAPKGPPYRIYDRLGFSYLYEILALFRDLKTPLALETSDVKNQSSQRRVEIRRSDERDDSQLLRIYQKNCDDCNGMALRDKEIWKRKFRDLFVYECPFYEEEPKPDNILLAEQEGDEIIGYAISCVAKRDTFGHICEILTLPGKEKEAGRPLAESVLASMRNQKPLILLVYSAENILNQQLFRRGSTPLVNYGGLMFETLDLRGVIETALQSTTLVNQSGNRDSRIRSWPISLRIKGGQSVTLKPDRGVMSVVEGEVENKVTFADHRSFSLLLFGARSLSELLGEGSAKLSLFDAKQGQVVSFFEEAFPKKPAMTYPSDWW